MKVWNLDDAVAEAKRLGCDVRVARRTGELVFTPPLASGLQRRRCNMRRKDANVYIAKMLARLAATERDSIKCTGCGKPFMALRNGPAMAGYLWSICTACKIKQFTSSSPPPRPV